MSEFSELDSIIGDVCAELAKKQPKPELIFSDEYCTSQCEFFDVCKANHDACVKQVVEEILKTLSDRECRVLKLRFGYEGNVQTQNKIAEQFYVTRERIQKIEQKALRKVKHPFLLRKLQPLTYTALSCENDNFYARFFIRVFHLSKDQVQNILASPQSTRETKKTISLDSGIESLELSLPTFYYLRRADIQTVEDLLKYPSEKVFQIRKIEPKSLAEICTKLEEFGFQTKAAEIEQIQNDLMENKNKKKKAVNHSERKPLATFKTLFNELLEYKSYYQYDHDCEVVRFADGEQHDAAKELYVRVVKTYLLENNDKWAFDIALDCVRDFTEEEFEFLQEHRGIVDYHFCYGMYVRNHYIYPSQLHIYLMADGVSSSVEKFIYSIMFPEYKHDKFSVKLDMPIEELGLSERSYCCLKRANIRDVDELVDKTPEEMMRVRELGKKSLEEIIAKLESYGLSLRDDG